VACARISALVLALRPPQAVAALHFLPLLLLNISGPLPVPTPLSNTPLGHCQPSRPFKTPQAVHKWFWSVPHDPIWAHLFPSSHHPGFLPPVNELLLCPSQRPTSPAAAFRASKAAHPRCLDHPIGLTASPDFDVIAAFASCDYPSTSPPTSPRPACKRELHEPFLHLIPCKYRLRRRR
jgi:hypothetical protein